MDQIKQTAVQRDFMKSNFDEWYKMTSDQQKKVPYPPLSKECPEDAIKIVLPEISKDAVNDKSIFDGIADRVSHRSYSGEPLTLDELGFLLYATQGVRKFSEGKFSMRTVPSGGARHPFETYLAVLDVDGIEPGMYRYLPFSHELVLLCKDDDLGQKLIDGTLGQKFCGESAVTFIWTCIPYRCEWRYHIAAHKTMLLDAGHLCQNLYLASEAIGSGTCAIAAYDQTLMDDLVSVDGTEEFVIYMAPVGKV